MRKYISVILLVLFLFVSNGYYLYFKYLQHNIRQEIKYEIRRGIDEAELAIITVSKGEENEIYWTEKNTEFKYKGAMYDIVKTEVKNNKTTYYCINDVKEQQLFTHFTKQNSTQNRILIELRKVISSKYFPEYYSITNSVKEMVNTFTTYQFIYKSIAIEILSPPPQIQH